MLFTYDGVVYIQANEKYYKLKLEGDNLVTIFDGVKYELPKEKVLISVEEAKKILKGSSKRNIDRE